MPRADVEKDLEEVARFTPQPKATIEFYEKFLDMKPIWQNEDAAEFKLDGVKFFVHKIASSEGSPARDHISFSVDDVEKACTELRSRGLKIEKEPYDYDWGRSAYLKDPDGRWLELHQKPKQATKRRRTRGS